MRLDWLPKLFVPLGISIALGLFRKFAPAPPPPISTRSYEQRQTPTPLPTGLIGVSMWGLGICFALSFFILRGANHLWAQTDGPASLRLYPVAAIWCFLPGFAAIAIPWPLTVWLLRRFGRTDEADTVETISNERGGVDSFKVMKWLSIGLVIPIAVFTLLAIPIHLSIADSEARVGHYGSFNAESFPFDQATRATLIEGIRGRDGTFTHRRDLLIDFSDGRRLDANAAGDGGTEVSDEVIQLLLTKTGLHPEHALTENDVPGAKPKM
jgi:hypothetical protein